MTSDLLQPQGSHPCYSKFTNFFRFRLSPLVSGAVYCAYLGYIIVLIPKAIDYHNDAVGNVRALLIKVMQWHRKLQSPACCQPHHDITRWHWNLRRYQINRF